jgi:hypothetical protein
VGHGAAALGGAVQGRPIAMQAQAVVVAVGLVQIQAAAGAGQTATVQGQALEQGAQGLGVAVGWP